MRMISNRWESIGALAAVVAVLGLCAGAEQALAQEQQVYADPGGVFSVTVPSGWQTQPQQGSPMVSIVNMKTKVSESVGVMRGPEANTPTAEKELEGIEGQFPQTCPQAKVLERGPQRLAGMAGSYLMVSCAGQQGPETMKFAAASKPGVVALLIIGSPGNAYLRELLPLRAIENSLKVLPVAPAQGGAPMPAQAGGGGQFAAPEGSGSTVYSDPQGRYSLAIPPGWNTASDNGSLTLSSGESWVTVATGSGAQPGDVNRQIVGQIQAQYKSFQVLNEGDFQNNGHPAHGTNATGINAKGVRVSVLVLSIGAGSGNYLILISSAPDAQVQQINGTVMQIAQSVKFAGE